MYFQIVIQMEEVEVFVDVLEEDKGKGEITYKSSPFYLRIFYFYVKLCTVKGEIYVRSH